MTDKTDARKMTDPEFQAGRDAIRHEAAARRMTQLQRAAAILCCESRLPEHDAWLERHGRLSSKSREVFKDDETPPRPPPDEQRLAALAERTAAIDAEVKAQVAKHFPHLLADADRQPKTADLWNELDRQVADAATAFFRSKGK